MDAEQLNKMLEIKPEKVTPIRAGFRVPDNAPSYSAFYRDRDREKLRRLEVKSESIKAVTLEIERRGFEVFQIYVVEHGLIGRRVWEKYGNNPISVIYDEVQQVTEKVNPFEKKSELPSLFDGEEFVEI